MSRATEQQSVLVRVRLIAQEIRGKEKQQNQREREEERVERYYSSGCENRFERRESIDERRGGGGGHLSFILLAFACACACVRACVRACVLKYIVWMEHEEKVCFELCFTNETHRARDLLHSVASQKID